MQALSNVEIDGKHIYLLDLFWCEERKRKESKFGKHEREKINTHIQLWDTITLLLKGQRINPNLFGSTFILETS